MALRTTRRIYSAQTLERWFDRLAHPWEAHFSDDELEEGRRIYRSGAIRTLELAEGEAIIHTGRGEEEIYAMVEWTNGQPQVRSSVSNRRLGRALGAAGLYEIEELVADELPPIEPEPKKARADRPEREEGPTRAPVESAPSGRRMQVRLLATPSGMRLQASWIDPLKGKGTAVSLGDHAQLQAGERETLIRLTGWARKGGFEFRPGRNDFLMRDPRAITAFLSREVPRWRRAFSLALDDSLAPWREGIREVRFRFHGEEDEEGLRFRWEAVGGGASLGEREVLKLLRNPSQVALLPGAGMFAVPQEQRAELRSWAGFADDKGLAKLPRYMALSLFAAGSVPVLFSGKIQQWIDRLFAEPEDLPGTPSVLRDYQRKGAAWLRHMASMGCHPLLADEMGLGKTIQMLSVLDEALRSGEPAAPHLVVCPASVIPVWQAEAERFFSGMTLEVLSSENPFRPGVPAVWLASYTQLRRHRALLDQVEFGCSVLDEAQAIKNPDAKVSQACAAIRARQRFAVTGTPVENRETDLWTLFRYLMPGLLGTRSALEAAVKGDREETGSRMRRQLAPFVLRRTKEQVARELPEKVDMLLVCPMSDLQVSEYRRLVREGLRSVGEDLGAALRERSLTFLSLLTRLRQVCCDPALLPWMEAPSEQSGKLARLVEKAGEAVESGRKVVVFSQFVSLLKRASAAMEAAYPKMPQWFLTGQTRDRSKPVREFTQRRGAGVLFASL